MGSWPKLAGWRSENFIHRPITTWRVLTLDISRIIHAFTLAIRTREHRIQVVPRRLLCERASRASLAHIRAAKSAHRHDSFMTLCLGEIRALARGIIGAPREQTTPAEMSNHFGADGAHTRAQHTHTHTRRFAIILYVPGCLVGFWWRASWKPFRGWHHIASLHVCGATGEDLFWK